VAFLSEVASRYRKGEDIPIGWTLADSPEPIGSDGGVLLDAWGSLRLPFFNTTQSMPTTSMATSSGFPLTKIVNFSRMIHGSMLQLGGVSARGA